MLFSMADGTILCPYVVFNRKILSKCMKFPKTLMVRANGKRFMNNHIVVEWVNLVVLATRSCIETNQHSCFGCFSGSPD